MPIAREGGERALRFFVGVGLVKGGDDAECATVLFAPGTESYTWGAASNVMIGTCGNWDKMDVKESFVKATITVCANVHVRYLFTQHSFMHPRVQVQLQFG